MTYEHKEGYGSLRKNKLKDAGSKQPDYKGDIMVDGKLWELAGWIKEGAKGPYMSLKGQEPRAKEGDAVDTRRGDVQDLPDGIPF